MAKMKRSAKGKMLLLAAIFLAIALFGMYTYVSGHQVVTIKASYDGGQTAGTVLDAANSGIRVTGRTKNRKQVDIPLGQWQIVAPQALKPDETATVFVEYQGKKCELRVTCTDSQAASIAAGYEGTLDAGTQIDIISEGFFAEATLRNGETVDITGQCTISGGPIMLKTDSVAVIQVLYTDPTNGREFSDSFEVRCATRTVKQLTASYTGSARTGEVLDSSNPGITVTATFHNGVVEPVEGWTVREPATLEESKSTVITICYGGKETKLVVGCSDFDEARYRKSCSNVSYDTLARFPESHVGDMVRIGGKITQVYPTTKTISGCSYRIRVSSGKYIQAEFQGSLDQGNLLEGDYVTCYGTYLGINSSDYEGCPVISARVITRNR